jgi:hypothetical protein
LDPDYHDSLLSDNENFSRSKTYFWAINTLREIEESISENIKQVEGCVDSWPRPRSSEDKVLQQTNHIKAQLTPCVERLSTMKQNFNVLREEAKALRDGVSVFNPANQIKA